MRIKMRLPLACLGALLWVAPATAAMNWCALEAITPNNRAEALTVISKDENLAGCLRQKGTSALQGMWSCPDNPETVDENELTMIHIAATDFGYTFAVGAFDLNNLDVVRNCPQISFRDAAKFDPSNIMHRDQITFPRKSLEITLLNSGPRTFSYVVGVKLTALASGQTLYAQTLAYDALIEGMLGFRPENKQTLVRLAGVDPLNNRSETIETAFVDRGSQVVSNEMIGRGGRLVVLTPPVGLSGVKEIESVSLNDHFYEMNYIFNSTADYLDSIGLLDRKYGASTRKIDGQCTGRRWLAGDLAIIGVHCPNVSDIVTFVNVIGRKQISAFEKQQGVANSPPRRRNAVDSDNY